VPGVSSKGVIMSKFNFEIQEGKVVIGLDTNEDQENVLDLSLNMSEAIQEAFQRGESLEDAKVISFGFEGKKLNIKLDSDRDGEILLDLAIDLGELFDELF